MQQNWFKYESLIKPVLKEIETGARKQRVKAANYVKGKIKKKALAMKVTGNLAKGVYAMHGKISSFVGTRAPAFHAYLLEFGTAKMRPHPVVYPTFTEEENEVNKILSEPWVN